MLSVELYHLSESRFSRLTRQLFYYEPLALPYQCFGNQDGCLVRHGVLSPSRFETSITLSFIMPVVVLAWGQVS
jgi:hypothetical protein